MSNHHLITHNGITDSIVGWSKRVGISPYTIYTRTKKLGWTTERALTVPVASRSGRPKKAKRSAPVAPVTRPFKQLTDQQRALQRHFHSLLRTFNRDLHYLMARSLDRGVVADLSKNANDRSTPVTQDSV
jgi:hypothetical protein